MRPHRVRRLARSAWLAAALSLAALPASADEGMWTLDHLPLAALRERYGFTPPRGWTERVQKGCVHFGGGSGSFVSPDGLVLTNHHVALGQLQKMSSAGNDHVRDGFFARRRDEEIPCPDLELKVLETLEDVTARVTAAVDGHAPVERQSAQRRAAIARLEQESTQRTRLKSEVVELYRGGQYWLYRYRSFKDVRLVMAPEEQIAFYGGDPDNFCFPRHDLDFAFFRVYENGRPYRPASWFRLSERGPSEGELVFVAGHPGATSRLKTVAQLEYERDAWRPLRIASQERRLAAVRAYAATGPEAARQSVDRIRGLENNLKRERAFLDVLRDPAFMGEKRAAEAALRERVAKAPSLAEAAGAWDRIASAETEMRHRYREWFHRELARGARLVTIAEQIVRYTAEVEKPNERRLKEYRESNLESLRFQIYSRAPIYPELDAVLLASQLEDAREDLGPGDPWVAAAVGGRAPAEVARGLMTGTAIGDVAVRRALIAGGRAAVEASQDPLIAWVRGLDPHYRATRAWRKDRIESVESQEGGRIARARFALDHGATYPDATGTLRLSPGRVAGYEQLTTRVPWRTTFYGLYDRAESFGDRPPFHLPPRVLGARGRVELATPLNFVSTNDIIGGNSGSPVLDRNLAQVGLVFDGNVQAFRWEFDYDDTQARTVSVDSAAILESLRRIYDMGALADELEGRAAGVAP